MGIYSGKTALVTGSSRGVGRHIVEHLLPQGAAVWGLARGESSLAHPDYHHLTVDLGSPEAIPAACAELAGAARGLDILINNAAVLTSQYAVLMSTRAMQDMFTVNLQAACLLSREAAKLMRKRRWGRIIQISSMAVCLEPAGDSIYAATKAGLQTFNNVLAREVAGWGITCNSLGITAIETDMLAQLPRQKIDAILAGMPIPRIAQPQDIMNVIDFFASPNSSYITAQTVVLGGLH